MEDMMKVGNIKIDFDRIELAFPLELPADQIPEEYRHLNNGEMHVLPKKIRQKLEDFDQKVFSFIQGSMDSSLGTDQRILGLVKQDEDESKRFLEKLNQYRQEYFELRDEILAQYNTLVENFISFFVDACVKKEYREKARASLKENIPSKEEYGNSFRLSVEEQDIE